MEAIVLAGGLGTRLRSAVPDLPKCMAPVAGKPFLSFVIDSLRMQGVQRFVFSLGYKAEVIQQYLKDDYPSLDYACAIETTPLGTGGAIKYALEHCLAEDVIIANGDTLFEVRLDDMLHLHTLNQSVCTLALKPMQHFDRYGVVELDEHNRILSFKEKQYYEEGLINGGLYLLKKANFLEHDFPEVFSFEKDFLEKFTALSPFYGCIQDGYFIDIGIPQDFEKAQSDLKPQPLDLEKVNPEWTLFLDRDGVINDEQVGSYVLNWEGFHFSAGVLEAMPVLSGKFGKIIIISNQRGVGRGLMTEEDLKNIHKRLVSEVEKAGGRIDHILYCTEKDNTCFFRKPNPGMALQARKLFPEIDLKKTIMVGNKPSDMRFGRAAGAFTVFLTTTNKNEPFPHPDVDLRFNTLLDFALALQS